MTPVNYSLMTLKELRRYVLDHRDNIDAFQVYIDRSQEEGHMITINLEDIQWQTEVDKTMSPFHHPQEEDYLSEAVEVVTSKGELFNLTTNLLRVYPETFNGYDAYMDIPMRYPQDIQNIKTVYSPRLEKRWTVVVGPTESLINGYFRGDYSENNPPAWVFGLRLI